MIEKPKFREGSKAALFLELAKPDSDGFSRKVKVKEFTGAYKSLEMGNGGSWCRDDGSLAKHYNVVRHKEKAAIAAVELQGYKKSPIEKPIPAHIRKEIGSKRCVVLATSDVQIDHKDGRRDDPRLADPKRVGASDFQPLSRAANTAKSSTARTAEGRASASTRRSWATQLRSGRETAATGVLASAAIGTIPSASTAK